MKDTWDRIEAWLRVNTPQLHASLRPGATDAQIAATEGFLGVTFPEDVRESYRTHDGQSSDGPGLIDGWEFLSLERMRGEWKVWKDLLDGGDFEGNESDPEGGVRGDWWNARWVPLTYSGSGDHHCLDLDPAPGGEPGQIILMWHDMPDRPRLATGFRAWMGRFAADLESALYAYSEDHGGLVRSDEIGAEDGKEE